MEQKAECGPLNIPFTIPSSFSGRGMEMREEQNLKGGKECSI